MRYKVLNSVAFWWPVVLKKAILSAQDRSPFRVFFFIYGIWYYRESINKLINLAQFFRKIREINTMVVICVFLG